MISPSSRGGHQPSTRTPAACRPSAILSTSRTTTAAAPWWPPPAWRISDPARRASTVTATKHSWAWVEPSTAASSCS